jgi:hypothetical protein
MDPLSSLTPTLRIDSLQTLQENKQHSPFSRGQILQGLVTGKNNDKFILDVKGQQFLADSKTPLQVGQRLNLQVTTLSPHITLQVLSEPLTQNIGKLLHLLSGEGQFLQQTSTLAAQLPANILSTISEQTLELFSSLAIPGSKSTNSAEQPGGQQLTQILSNLFAAADVAGKKNTFVQLQNFINQLAQSLPSSHSALPQVQLLQREFTANPKISLQHLMNSNENSEQNAQVNALLQSISQLSQNISQLPSSKDTESTLVELLLQFMRNENVHPTPLLHKLLTLSRDLLQHNATSQESIPTPTGRQLQQFVNRLGTNMEQLLASGRQEEAVQTLKSALLEISHTFAGDNKIQYQAEQLTSTIQLYQMLQIRLASEDLSFLPLPLPFLNQSFLLIEPDQQQGGEQQSDKEKKKYTLHLNLEGLGNLQIDIQQQTSGMRFRFFAEDASRAKFLSEKRDELQQWLTATRLESVQFLTGAENPTKQLVSRITSGQTGMLNTKA